MLEILNRVQDDTKTTFGITSWGAPDRGRVQQISNTAGYTMIEMLISITIVGMVAAFFFAITGNLLHSQGDVENGLHRAAKILYNRMQDNESYSEADTVKIGGKVYLASVDEIERNETFRTIIIKVADLRQKHRLQIEALLPISVK